LHADVLGTVWGVVLNHKDDRRSIKHLGCVSPWVVEGEAMNRREFLRDNSVVVGAAMAASTLPTASSNVPGILIDPVPQFEISPYLYMQFMEPLGTTDGSVEAAWDYDIDDWRKDFVDRVRQLSPGLVRFGGLFSRYYRWREGVGPAGRRPWQRNYVWGGKETNRVGTHEFVDFCRRVGAEPLYCVNFLSDGRRQFWKTRDGEVRTADAKEAADWVSYANDPDNPQRRANGTMAPYNIKLWQLGNETSYGDDGFTKEESIQHTIEFAKAMRERDRSIQLIGWGDRGYEEGDPLWAGDLLDRAGEYIDHVAIHMMGQHPRRPHTALKGLRYEQEPEQAWEELLELTNRTEARIRELEEVISSQKSSAGICVTEGHLSLRPHNTNPILREWLTGVFHARSLNIYQRHGARVKIATAADFCGTRWTVNAVLLQVPRGVSYLTPAGSVMQLFKKHNGRKGLAVMSGPSDLDIVASRSGDQVFLHVANLNYSRAVEARLAVKGMSILGGRIYGIAPDNLREYVDEDRPDVFAPKEAELPPGESVAWRFPAGSVSAIQLRVSNRSS
jgi:alpha-N-arabinofuranosidase